MRGLGVDVGVGDLWSDTFSKSLEMQSPRGWSFLVEIHFANGTKRSSDRPKAVSSDRAVELRSLTPTHTHKPSGPGGHHCNPKNDAQLLTGRRVETPSV